MLSNTPRHRVDSPNACAHHLSGTLRLELGTMRILDDGEVAVVLQHPYGSPSMCFSALRDRAEGMVANAVSW